MKVMFLACNPKEESDLTIEHEITELQLQFLAARGEPVQFISLPRLAIEDFPTEIGRQQPDILHITAHGDPGHLELARKNGPLVKITGLDLKNYINIEKPPRLIYLNACDSELIADAVVEVAAMAIGTTAPLSNSAARASAQRFYDRLLAGSTVQQAFEAGKATLESLDKGASSVLRRRGGVDPSREYLHRIPRIVAHFSEDDYKPYDDGDFDIEIGVTGCPAHTSQLVMFTDHKDFVDEDEDDLDLCWVVRTNPTHNTIWLDESIYFDGDVRLFSTGVAGYDVVFSVGTTLCQALEQYFIQLGRGVPPGALAAIEKLRMNSVAGGLVTTPPSSRVAPSVVPEAQLRKTSRGGGRKAQRK